ESGAWTDVASGAKVTVSEDGVHEYQYRAVDQAGNVSEVQGFTVKIDRLPPVSTLTGVPAGWSRTKVTPALSATDSASGIAEVSYRINGGDWLTGPLPQITAEGLTTIDYKATDMAGNEEEMRTATVRIDRKAPVAKGLASSAKRRAKARLRFVVKDAAPSSGKATVSKIIIKNRKGKKVRTFRPNVKVPVNSTRGFAWKCTLAKGKYTFVVYAKDLAGNTASRRTGKLTVK
ncbi:MAG: hypothetical protein GX624_07025, partial [Actinobacteria bacterium]|nr:hypothetical protein [Actinomycetota bacterium]